MPVYTSPAKDALAKVLIDYVSTGVFVVGKAAIFAAAVAAGILSKGHAKTIEHALSHGKPLSGSKSRAWAIYNSTGNLGEALMCFFE